MSDVVMDAMSAMAEERGFAYVEVPGGDHDSPLFIGFTENSSVFKPFDWMEGC